MMKKFCTLLLLVALCVGCLMPLCSCKESKYERVESTDEEKRIVMRLELGGKTYDVRYELYRALFLNLKSTVDGGDETVWEGEQSEAYTEQIDALILDRICEIYSAFALCNAVGIDIYSSKVEDTIDEYIRADIEGGEGVVGYGSYEKYLEALKKMNLNCQTQVLLYRYAIAVDMLDEHYIGTFDAEDISDSIAVGSIQYTREDVEQFYFSDGCVRVLRAMVDPSNYFEHQVEEKVNAIRELILQAASKGESAVAAAMIGNTTMAGSEVERGYVIGRHNLDNTYYGGMTEAAFALSGGEVSEPIYVNDGSVEAYYILYRAEKSDSNFDECYSDIAYVFLRNKVGGYMDEMSLQLKEGARATEILEQIDRASISMD